jgi:hypothetical protein
MAYPLILDRMLMSTSAPFKNPSPCEQTTAIITHFFKGRPLVLVSCSWFRPGSSNQKSTRAVSINDNISTRIYKTQRDRIEHLILTYQTSTCGSATYRSMIPSCFPPAARQTLSTIRIGCLQDNCAFETRLSSSLHERTTIELLRVLT